MKKKFIEFMREIGTDLIDIKIKVETRSISTLVSPMTSTPQMSQNVNMIELKLVYKDFVIDYNEESSGIKKLFQFVCPMIDILENGKVLVCDEIEAQVREALAKVKD